MKNLKTTLNSKRCLPRIYAIEEGAADIPSFDNVLDSREMSDGYSSCADEELERENLTSHAGDTKPMHNANHSEDTVKEFSSPFYDMPTFYQISAGTADDCRTVIFNHHYFTLC